MCWRRLSPASNMISPPGLSIQLRVQHQQPPDSGEPRTQVWPLLISGPALSFSSDMQAGLAAGLSIDLAD